MSWYEPALNIPLSQITFYYYQMIAINELIGIVLIKLLNKYRATKTWNKNESLMIQLYN